MSDDGNGCAMLGVDQGAVEGRLPLHRVRAWQCLGRVWPWLHRMAEPSMAWVRVRVRVRPFFSGSRLGSGLEEVFVFDSNRFRVRVRIRTFL